MEKMKKKGRSIELFCIIISIFITGIAVFFYYNVSNYITSAILILKSLFLMIIFKNKYKTYINSCSIFSAIWFGTIGLSALRLHQLQTEWKIETFVYLELAYIAFLLGYMLNLKIKNKKDVVIKENINNIINKKKYFSFIILFFIMVITGFIIEVIIRRYIPLFTENMASYQEFSVTGIHYFTVSSCLIMPISYIFIHYFKITKWEKINLIIINAICLAIPILLVSRQLLIMTIILTFFTVIFLNKKNETKLIICAGIMVILAWTIIGNYRNQSEEYLKQVLQIQDDSILSVENMQLYMYITFNYDNFNANVGNIEKYTYGTQSFFPVLALTGLKFLVPELVKSTAIRVISVYNTYPIVMTPYEDFGFLGIFIYMLIVGFICRKIDGLDNNNPINILMKMLIKYSLVFSFFVSYFSNATMWFYIIILFIYKIIFFNKIILLEKNERNELVENSTSINVDI